MVAVGVVVARKLPPPSSHVSAVVMPEKMEFPVTVRFVVVASVVELLTRRRLVIVEVPELTTMPPWNDRRVEVASEGNGQEYAAAGQDVLQVSELRQMVPALKTVAPRLVEVAFVACSAVAKSVVEVAFVVVPLVPRKLVMRPPVACSAVAKSDVEVAFVVVAFNPVKFASVEEAKEMRPPYSWEAKDVDVATT